jgi:hypothetical protein
MRLGATLRRRRQSILAVLTALSVFALILVLWIGRSPAGNSYVSLPSAGGTGAGTGISALPSDSTTPADSTSPGSGTSSPGTALSNGKIPPGNTLSLPPFSSDINGAGAGTHIVSMSVSSDKTILQLSYAVKGATPGSGYHTYVKSPSSIHAVAHGDGIVAELAAQASPGSNEITCTMTVDGVSETHTAKGAFAVVLCLA